MIDMLHIQLRDNRKAVWVDGQLRNVRKGIPDAPSVRAQYAFYEYLQKREGKK